MCAWAIVSTCTGAVQSYQGLLALRFILGFVEAPFFRMDFHSLSLDVHVCLTDVCSRCIIPLLVMVYQKRACRQNLNPLRCRSDRRGLWWPARKRHHVWNEWKGWSTSLAMALYAGAQTLHQIPFANNCRQ